MAQFWERFPLDPQDNRDIRASDAERDLAAEELRQAHVDGRLDLSEYQDRLDSAMSARTLGDVADLLDDLSPPAPTPARREAARGAQERRLAAESHWWRSLASVASNWAFVALVTNVMWLLASGGNAYYWPLWPMLGLAFPVLGTLTARGEIVAKHEAKLERRDRARSNRHGGR